jgi:OmcA/MtrC family decaheme c-type cytochrome
LTVSTGCYYTRKGDDAQVTITEADGNHKRVVQTKQEETMIGKKLWYFVTFVALMMLPLAGCSGGGTSSATIGEKGTQLTVSGKLDTGKATAKTVGLTAIAMNTVQAIDAQDGTSLGTSAIDAEGKFTGFSFTLPSAKTIVVFKATVSQGTFLNVTPIDLSNPPTGITTNNPINIVISQSSTATAQVVSQLLGLSGDLGDAGQTLNSLDPDGTYAATAQLVVDNGGQQLAYGSNGIALTGKFSSAALLPAQDANTLDANTLNNMTLDGSITSVSIPGNKPVVSFQVINKDTGKGITGLKAFNLVIAQLKPAANGSPSEWLSYQVTGATSRPSTDSGYSVIDNGDGSYTVVFGKDIKAGTGGTVVYDANLAHRLMVGIRTTPSVALLQNGSTLSNFYNEKYFIKDFVPANPAVAPTERRDLTTTAACNECHTKIGVTTPHGGRGEVKYCMMCHTTQRGNGRTNSASVNGVFTGTTYIADGEVTLDMVTMIHKIHMGNKLTKTGYDLAGIKVNEITYPKEINNCRQCHRGDNAAELALAPQGDHWRTKPSRKACGSCHDNINFATGANLKQGGAAHSPQANDANCASCHGDADLYHMSINATPNNPKVPAGLVNFFYEINSATVDATTNNLTIKFRIQKNTGLLTATKSNVVFDGTATNPLVGYTGGPSFLLAYNLDAPNQPAINFAADYNNYGVIAAQPKTVTIGSLIGATTGTLGTPDANGYYSAVVNSASAFPVGAKLRAVGLQGYFTQAAGTGSIAAATARHALSAVKSVTGDAVRRDVIDSAKCATCHEWFEGHGGNRVVGKDTVGQSICTLCHVPNLSSSGKGTNAAAATFPASMTPAEQALLTADGYTLLDPTTYPEETNNFKDMIHGIHAGSSRTAPLKFVRDRTSVVLYFSAATFKFPGLLQNCAMCHKGTTYTSIPADAQVTTNVTTNGTALNLTNNVSVVSASRTTVPNATDLVTTPFVATCVSCHDKPSSVAHFKLMGGQIRVLRSDADPAKESCVTCHGITGPNALWNAHRFGVVGE